MLVLKKIREYAKTGRTALVNRDERMTFAELDARSEAFAAWLLGWFGNDRAPVVICGEKESNFLLDVCREKGIEPLFIHVPLHGQWSDYTGFAADRRTEYYEHVRSIAQEYGVKLLDLTGFEYEPYFMCDTMHLGWKGWLAVDQALISYYYEQ